MNVRPPLIANSQPAELVQPGQRPFHYPPIDSRPAPMLGGAFSQDWLNPEPVQHLTMRLRVIGPVSLNSIRLAPRTSSLATNQRNRRHQGQQLGQIMPISSGQDGCQRNPISVGKQMLLTPSFRPVGGIGSRFFPRHQRLGWRRYPPWCGTNRSDPPLLAWPAALHAALPHPCLMPVSWATPTGHARAATHLLG
jgi:hypothetical protein